MAQPVAPAGSPAVAAPADDGSIKAVAGSTFERMTSLAAWQGPAHWRLLASPYAFHWRPSDEHQSVYALGIERQYDDHWLLGGAAFSNSFGQPSAYAYLGHRTEHLFGEPALFFQWSVGVMYGYVDEYKDKVPLNVGGFSPGALVGLGWKVDRHWSVAAHLLGDAGVLFQIAYDLH